MSNSTQTLHVGSYAEADKPGIFEFAFNSETGSLTERSSMSGIEAPAYLAIHPNGKWMYVTSEVSKPEGQGGAIYAVNIEGSPMEIINSRPSGGDLPCHLAIDATARWIVVSNYGSGTASVTPILEDGSLGEMSDLARHEGSGPNAERQEGPHAHSSIFSPDNRFLIVADLGIDALMVYRFDAEAGKLSLHEQVEAESGAGPRHMAWHPQKAVLYAANELGSTIAVYDYDAAEGRLKSKQVVSTLPARMPENLVADIHVTQRGDRVFISNRRHDTIACFGIEENGTLKHIATTPCGGKWPRTFALAPGERFMVVANEHSNRVSVLPVTQDGPGEPVATAENIYRASIVQFLQ